MRISLFVNVISNIRKVVGQELRAGYYGFRVIPVDGGYRLAAQHDTKSGIRRLVCVGSLTPFTRQKDAIAYGLAKFNRLAKPLNPAERSALNDSRWDRIAA